ncbi:MAG: molybdopterin molybdotransferase MoeA [Campylobacterota bacterium]
MNNKLTYLEFEQAVQKSLELAKPQILKEMIPLQNAIGRVVAKDIKCIKNLPAFNNSAMDGFAIKIEDANKTLNIKKTIFAGDKNEKTKPVLQEGECYKIMTGAKVPDDADTIIPIENCIDVTDTTVKTPSNLKKGANLRFKAEEQKQGNILFTKKEVLNSSNITLLASQGITMVEVYKKISIAVVSTGDELKEPWENSDDEEIYNCNSYALVSLLSENGFDATYSGVIPDNLKESKEFISNMKSYDVIITTGGISMGDADFINQAFIENGLKTAFHGVNVKPGRPIMMGQMGNTSVMCLPGNPLTAIVNMHLFVLPVLHKIQGSNRYFHDINRAVNIEEFKTKQGRVNVVLGTLENGGFKATRNNKYGSGMITALCESNSILVTNKNTDSIKQNQEVSIIKFNSELLKKYVNIFN